MHPRPLVLVLLMTSGCRTRAADLAPVESEICNGEDDDGDGLVDEDLPETVWGYADADQDGFGDAEHLESLCGPLEGYAPTAGDCDDTRPGVNPAAADPGPTCGDGIDDCSPEACRYHGRYELEQAAVASWAHVGGVHSLTGAALVGDLDQDGREDLGLGAYVITSVTRGEHDGPTAALAHLEATGNVVGWLRPARDTNGDGRDDLLVMGISQVMPDGRRATAWVLTEVTAGESDVTEVGLPLYEPEDLYDGEGIGDLDGDGFGEVLLGGGSGYSTFGAYLYRGSPSGPSYQPSASVTGDHSISTVGWAGGMGDLDGDGRDDFAVNGCWDSTAPTPHALGLVCIFNHLPSGDSSFADSTDVFVTAGEGEWMADIEPAGDLNADGYDDLLVGHYTQYDGPGHLAASMVLGPLVGDHSLLQADARFFTDDPYNADFIGAVVTGAGDMDGDGADDFAIALDREGVVYLYYGMREGTQQMADADATFSHRTYYAVGNTIDGGADLDQDGYDDLLIASPFYEHDAGIAFLIGGWAP